MAPQTFGQKLQQVLTERNMGRRTLARILAPDSIETSRRQIRKWIDQGVKANQASRDSVTDALGLERGALDPDEDEDSDLDKLIKRLMLVVRDQVADGQRAYMTFKVGDDRLAYSVEAERAA